MMIPSRRIAWTAFCGITALLLVVLWVRSYWRADICAMVVSDSTFVGVASTNGTIRAFRGDNQPGAFASRWDIETNVIANRGDDRLSSSPAYHGAFGFGICLSSTPFLISAPYWFFVLVLGAMTAFPWLSLPSLPRFSLNNLLRATTIVAFVLGLVVYVLRK